MIRRKMLTCLTLAGLAPAFVGCTSSKQYYFQGERQATHYRQQALDIEYPAVQACAFDAVEMPLAPRLLEDPKPEDMWNVTLEEVLRTALENSKVITELGGRVVTAPASMVTMQDPAITESNPRTGVEAALAAFDAQLNSSLIWNKFDRPVNRSFAGVFLPLQEQDLGTFRSELSKATASGGTTALRYNVDYEWNNNPTNLFPSAWTNNVEAEVRHPLLQGAGVEFNRIAGPNSQPGLFFSNGVLLARINTDISLADFEGGVRNFVSDVENAYWDLYFAYRDLDAKLAGRDAALSTWRQIEDKAAAGARGGEAAAETQARQQYFRFRALVENSLAGTAGGSTVSGVGAGIFRGAGGLYARENNLRYLMGLPVTDGKLLRPIDEPSTVKVKFDWESSVAEALQDRVELRRQRWTIKSRELELIASRNFLMPRLDAVALYRWYGLGDDFIDPNGSGGFDNAVQNLTEGDYQEWQLGFQFNMPLGFRAQMAGVRNSELRLARERAILREQERRILHDLTLAHRELERSYQLVQTNFNLAVAASQEVKAVGDTFEAGNITINVLLDAQRRLAEAQTDYYRSLVEYNLAIKGLHFEKGSLLEYNGVQLAEGMWNPKAYRDASRLNDSLKPRGFDYRFSHPYRLSDGVVPQGDVCPPGVVEQVIETGSPTPALESLPDLEPPPKPSPADAPVDPIPPPPASAALRIQGPSASPAPKKPVVDGYIRIVAHSTAAETTEDSAPAEKSSAK